MDRNPYQTPQSDVNPANDMPDRIYRHLAIGQKLIIFSIVLYLLSFALVYLLGNIGTITGLVSLALALIGTVRTLIGVDWSILIKVLYVVLMFVPLINLLALASLNNKVTTMLKDAGYKVGFFGVKG